MKCMKEIGRKIKEAESYDNLFSAILYHHYNLNCKLHYQKVWWAS